MADLDFLCSAFGIRFSFLIKIISHVFCSLRVAEMSCFYMFETLLFDTYQGIVCVSSSSSEESPARQPSILTCGTKAALDTVSNVMKEALEGHEGLEDDGASLAIKTRRTSGRDFKQHF